MWTWVKLHIPHIVAAFVWIGVVAGIYWFLYVSKLTLAEALAKTEALLAARWYGPVIFFGMFMIRPLMLVPAFLMLILGGRIFGLEQGFIYGVPAMTCSAILPFLVGRRFAGEIGEGRQLGGIRRVSRFLRSRPFQALLTLRMTNVFYDMTSLVAGSLGVAFPLFFIATFLGNVSIVFAFASLGAALEGDFLDGSIHIDLRLVIVSVLALGFSLGGARYLRARLDEWRTRRQERREDAAFQIE
jgi:uncharacterized membrane protein YdjX (TVP38/TMEM64 family)